VRSYNIKCLVDANCLLILQGHRQVTYVDYVEKVAIGLHRCKVVSLLIQAI